MLKPKATPRRTFIPMHGRWQFKGDRAVFQAPDQSGTPVGLCLSPRRFQSGTIHFRATIGGETTADQYSSHRTELDGNRSACCAIGYSATTEGYYAIGIGGYGAAFVVLQFVPGQGWRAIQTRGSSSQLVEGHSYDVQVEVAGQRVSLTVDGVRVIDIALPAPLSGDQCGLYAWGHSQVGFEAFEFTENPPKVFVVMQFGEPYDSLYRDVIQTVSQDLGYDVLRADDLSRPGVILQDIRRGIVESDVIVAEITPVNANVFYELGYAHALEKPTILLASRKTERLPFDISGYRVVFYDDTIGGKREIETNLRRYLETIRSGQSRPFESAA